jgi:hypothetical protein
MTKRKKRWIIILAIVCASPLVCYYPLSRMMDYTECWEESCYSPSQLLEKSDVVELGVLTRYRHIGEISYPMFGDTTQDDVTEFVYKTAVSAKGRVDSIAVWTLEPIRPSERSFCVGDTTLVYGLKVAYPDSIIRMTAYCSGSTTDSAEAPALLASPNVMHELALVLRKMPVIVLSDDGRVFDWYSSGYDLCYYDENRDPHCISPKKYWREVIEAAK